VSGDLKFILEILGLQDASKMGYSCPQCYCTTDTWKTPSCIGDVCGAPLRTFNLQKLSTPGDPFPEEGMQYRICECWNPIAPDRDFSKKLHELEGDARMGNTSSHCELVPAFCSYVCQLLGHMRPHILTSLKSFISYYFDPMHWLLRATDRVFTYYFLYVMRYLTDVLAMTSANAKEAYQKHWAELKSKSYISGASADCK
jgi:hypothetical protein